MESLPIKRSFFTMAHRTMHPPGAAGLKMQQTVESAHFPIVAQAMAPAIGTLAEAF